MLHPWKDPWGISPSLRPSGAWAVLTDPPGRCRPVGPPRLSHDANIGHVCHCHCGGDCRSGDPVGLIWVNGSLGCRTVAARTRDWILDTLLSFTVIYRFLQSNTKVFEGLFTISVKFWGHVEILAPV